jgi:hypothetical protein
MTNGTDHDRLVTRLSEIVASIDRYEAKIAALRDEANDISIAQQVLERLSGGKKRVGFTEIKPKGANEKKVNKLKSKPRPEGIPTTPEMMRLAIIDANKRGLLGMTGQELYEYIGKTWWPGVDPNLIKPTAWRLEKEGRLGKDGDKYTLPKDKNQSDENAKLL